jgi:hypothetical protein
MIVSANLLIRDLKDGILIGEDITDGVLYNGKFSTDIDINKMINKERPKFFKNKQVDQKMLLEMLEISNKFNDRDKKVNEKIELELKNNSFLKEVKKSISRLEEDKEYIFGEDEEEVKFRNKELIDFIETKIVNKNNFEVVYSKLKELYISTTEKLKKEVNLSYDIGINCPVVFTGNLIKDNETILSKNAYVDLKGNLTGRNAFYSAGIRGDFFEDDLTIILTIKKETEKSYSYIAKGKYLTKNKTFNIIKRNINTIEKIETDLLISFIKKDKNNQLKEVEKYINLVKDFHSKINDKVKRKDIFKNYKNDIINVFKEINNLIENEEGYCENLNKIYDIKIPILNNFELEKNITEMVNKEFNLFKNINKKFLNELIELRSKKGDKTKEKIREDMELYIKKQYETKINEKGLYGTYFRIAGRKDFDNTGYGFITEVPKASKKVKNFMGFFINIHNLKLLKEEIFNDLSKIKEKLEK